MPLVKSASNEARSENIKELMSSNPNRPLKQAIAIAYHNQREAQRHTHEEREAPRHEHEKHKYGR